MKILEGITLVAVIPATWYVTNKIDEKEVAVAVKQKEEAVSKLKEYEDLEKLGGIPQLIKELKTAAIEANAALKEKNAATLLEAARKDLSQTKARVEALEAKLTTAQAEVAKLASVQTELTNAKTQNSGLSAENARLKTSLQAWEVPLKELEEFTVEQGATHLIFGNQIVIGVRSISSSSFSSPHASLTFNNESLPILDVGKYHEFSFGGGPYRLVLKKVTPASFNKAAKDSATFGVFPNPGQTKIQ